MGHSVGTARAWNAFFVYIEQSVSSKNKETDTLVFYEKEKQSQATVQKTYQFMYHVRSKTDSQELERVPCMLKKQHARGALKGIAVVSDLALTSITSSMTGKYLSGNSPQKNHIHSFIMYIQIRIHVSWKELNEWVGGCSVGSRMWLASKSENDPLRTRAE